jgi:hypothetical protein
MYRVEKDFNVRKKNLGAMDLGFREKVIKNFVVRYLCNARQSYEFTVKKLTQTISLPCVRMKAHIKVILYNDTPFCL